MLEEAKRTLAYICPVCGKAVAVERTAFQLAASVNHLPCPCGKSELVIEMKGDQCHVQVPCVFCGRDHKVACSTKSFLHEKVLAFSCSASGLDCLYAGEEEPVFRALSRLEEAVDRMVLNDQAEEKSPFLDELVMGEVLGELKEIAAQGGVSCLCGSRDYTVRVGYSTVELVCADCGRTLRLNAATADDIDAICCKTKLVIGGEAPRVL